MNNNNIRYNKLPEILHHIRWSQHLAAIIAEALMVGAFFLSGLDVAVGGVMATNGVVRWLWGVMFSISLDSLFIISWLRVKRAGWSWHLAYSIPIALAMSLTVFLPVLVQLLQSSLVVNFTTALDMLGIGLVPLVIVRALVSVILGAVLALTNSEEVTQQSQPQPILNQAPSHVMMSRQVQEQLPVDRQIAAPEDARPAINALDALNQADSIDQQADSIDTSSRVAAVLEDVPDAGVRDIAKSVGINKDTASSIRRRLNIIGKGDLKSQ